TANRCGRGFRPAGRRESVPRRSPWSAPLHRRLRFPRPFRRRPLSLQSPPWWPQELLLRSLLVWLLRSLRPSSLRSLLAWLLQWLPPFPLPVLSPQGWLLQSLPAVRGVVLQPFPQRRPRRESP